MAGNAWTECRQTGRRLALALGASLIAHALLITGLGSPPPRQSPAAKRLSLSISLRAAPLPVWSGQIGAGPAAQNPQPAAAPASPPEPSPPPEQAPAARPPVSITPSLPGWIANLPTEVDLNYYPASALAVVAIPTTEIQALLPEGELERVAGQRTTLRLRLLINEHGVVDDVELVANDAPDALQDRALSNVTAEAFRRMRFQPALRNGLPVRSRKEIEVCLGACDPDLKDPAAKAATTIQITPQALENAAATAPRPIAERVRRDK